MFSLCSIRNGKSSPCIASPGPLKARPFHMGIDISGAAARRPVPDSQRSNRKEKYYGGSCRPHAPIDRGRRPFRPPDPPLEPAPEAAQLRRPPRPPHHPPLAKHADLRHHLGPKQK